MLRRLSNCGQIHCLSPLYNGKRVVNYVNQTDPWLHIEYELILFFIRNYDMLHLFSMFQRITIGYLKDAIVSMNEKIGRKYFLLANTVRKYESTCFLTGKSVITILYFVSINVTSDLIKIRVGLPFINIFPYNCS